MIPYDYFLDHFTFYKHMTSMSNAQEHCTAAGITSVMWVSQAGFWPRWLNFLQLHLWKSICLGPLLSLD